MRFCTWITGRLMADLTQCIPQKLCDLVITWWCGRSHNCWNQSTWFILDEAKATPWFPWEGWSKTLGQGYDPSEHSFPLQGHSQAATWMYDHVCPVLAKTGKPLARNILTPFPLLQLVSRNERHDLDLIYTNCGVKDQIPPKAFCIQTLWKWTNAVQFSFVCKCRSCEYRPQREVVELQCNRVLAPSGTLLEGLSPTALQ